jgi:hypothetical protein
VPARTASNTDHWTLERITTVIERVTGVAYHRGHVWKLLRHRLHYRLLRPARRAIERDERAAVRDTRVRRGLGRHGDHAGQAPALLLTSDPYKTRPAFPGMIPQVSS